MNKALTTLVGWLVVLSLLGCGPPPASETPADMEMEPIAIPNVGDSWAGLAVYVPESLASMQYRGAVLDALREAGVTIVDGGEGEGVIMLQLNPSAPSMSVSGAIIADVTMTQQLSASIFHRGTLIDQVSASQQVTISGMNSMTKAQHGYVWLARKVVQQLLSAPKVVAIAESQAGGAVASAADDGRPDSGRLLAGTPQAASYAFIVGVETYRDLPAPTGARADALAIAELARTSLGIPDDQVRVALDDRASAGDIRRGLKWLAENTPAGGRAYFYFSGHGAPDASSGASYLVPYDGDPLALDETALPLDGVVSKLAGGSAGETLVVLDSCFSGAGGRSVLPKGTRPLARVKVSKVPGTVALLSAATGAEVSGATKAGDRGLFTTHVVEALGRGQADIDGDAQITLAELMQWLKPRVSRDAKAAGRQQHPSLQIGSGGQASRFVVARGIRP